MISNKSEANENYSILRKQVRIVSRYIALFILASFTSLSCAQSEAQNEQRIRQSLSHQFVQNGEVRLHTVTAGSGPVILLLHGFPDYWYTWRNLIPALSDTHQVVAMDLRGYNLSDKPQGVDNYAMTHLVSDVVAVLNFYLDEGEAAVLLGHDWGGAIAWQTAIAQPVLIERLIVFSTPHPAGLVRELTNNQQQVENSQYALDLQSEGASESLSPESLAAWVTDESDREEYIAAFQRSDIQAMLNYYKASYPTGSTAPASNQTRRAPVMAPTLTIFGLQDEQLLPAGFNSTWEYVDSQLTMVAIPEAGHFVQHDAPQQVHSIVIDWIGREMERLP